MSVMYSIRGIPPNFPDDLPVAANQSLQDTGYRIAGIDDPCQLEDRAEFCGKSIIAYSGGAEGNNFYLIRTDARAKQSCPSQGGGCAAETVAGQV